MRCKLPKQVMISKIALQEDLDFLIKKNLSKYINKEFKGDITLIKKNSKLVKILTEVREKGI